MPTTVSFALMHTTVILHEVCITRTEELTGDTISGDGTECSKYSNFTILSFCLLNTKNEIMMPKGEQNYEYNYRNSLLILFSAKHILAIVRISETYKDLAMSLRPLLAEINYLLERKEIICSDGRRQRIDIYFCGDL